MRVAFNATFLGEQHSGISTFAEGLIDSLLDQHYEVVLYSSKVPANAAVDLNRTSPWLRADNGGWASLCRFAWLQTALPWRLRKQNVRLFFSPIAEGMLFPSVRQIVQVHDLIPLFYPEECPRLVLYYRYFLPRVIAASRMVFVDSEHTRRDLANAYSVPEEKIAVIYGGLKDEFFAAESAVRPPGFELDRYFVFVGSYAPRKNLDTVIQALARIASDVREDLAVVARDHPRATELRALAGQLGLGDRIRFLTGLAVSQLAYVYQHATALVLLSEYEGFGYPPLEAMAMGTPAIVSDSTALAEVVADAAIKVPARDVEAAAAAMLAFARDADYRYEYARRGRERAQRFTWQHSAEQLRCGIARATSAL